ncbi:unnamed protein product [Peniophora sp. CBMAI 1063]|nr:unnamed protein product [Peniophora sp. CBMAI 1063]
MARRARSRSPSRLPSRNKRSKTKSSTPIELDSDGEEILLDPPPLSPSAESVLYHDSDVDLGADHLSDFFVADSDVEQEVLSKKKKEKGKGKGKGKVADSSRPSAPADSTSAKQKASAPAPSPPPIRTPSPSPPPFGIPSSPPAPPSVNATPRPTPRPKNTATNPTPAQEPTARPSASGSGPQAAGPSRAASGAGPSHRASAQPPPDPAPPPPSGGDRADPPPPKFAPPKPPRERPNRVPLTVNTLAYGHIGEVPIDPAVPGEWVRAPESFITWLEGLTQRADAEPHVASVNAYLEPSAALELSLDCDRQARDVANLLHLARLTARAQQRTQAFAHIRALTRGVLQSPFVTMALKAQNYEFGRQSAA